MYLKITSSLFLVLWIIIGSASARSKPQARQAEVLTDDDDTQGSSGGGGGGGNPPACQITDAQADSAIAYIFTHGNSGRNAPENLGQLPSFCSNSRDKVPLVKSYQSKCLPVSQIQICLEGWTSTVDTRLDSFCRVPSNNQPTKEQIKLFGASACGNAVKSTYQKCINDKICEINAAAQIRDERKRLATICCNLDSVSDCIHSATLAGDPKKCNPQKANDSKDFYDSFRKCWNTCLCGDFTPLSDSCKAFRTPSGRSDWQLLRTGGGGGGGDCTKGIKSIEGAVIAAVKNVKVPNWSRRSADEIIRSCK